MTNVFATDNKIHERFDLKVTGRKTPPSSLSLSPLSPSQPPPLPPCSPLVSGGFPSSFHFFFSLRNFFTGLNCWPQCNTRWKGKGRNWYVPKTVVLSQVALTPLSSFCRFPPFLLCWLYSIVQFLKTLTLTLWFTLDHKRKPCYVLSWRQMQEYVNCN